MKVYTHTHSVQTRTRPTLISSSKIRCHESMLASCGDMLEFLVESGIEIGCFLSANNMTICLCSGGSFEDPWKGGDLRSENAEEGCSYV